MSVVEQIQVIIEQLPAAKQELILELVKSMVSPENILTKEDKTDTGKDGLGGLDLLFAE